MGATLATPALGIRSAAETQEPSVQPKASAGKSASLFLPEDDLKPATYDRLPLEWNKQRARKLQEILGEEGYDGILLTDRWNIIYFTGLWHTTTERLFYAFLPTKASDPIWFYPALDRDLVKTWWYSDGKMYFDWHHAKDAFPNEGKVHMGAKVDLFEWVLQGLRRRGFAGKKLGADRELTPSAQRKWSRSRARRWTPPRNTASECACARLRRN